MKKIIACIFCIVLVFCTGCSHKYTQDIDVKSDNKVEYRDITDAQNYYSECNIADDGVGYYFTDPRVDGSTVGYVLFYYDKNVGQAVPLCSKINCNHSDQSCDAYFTKEECMDGFIWYQNHSLFRIEKDNDTGNVYLVSFNRDGSNPVRGNILWNGDNVRYSEFKTIYFRSMVMHKGYLYYTYQLDVNDDVSVYRVNIDGNGERELLGTIPNSNDIKSVGEIHLSNDNENVYFSVECSLNNTDELAMVLCQYNINSGDFNTVMQEKGTKDYQLLKDDSGKVVGTTGNGWSGNLDIMDLAFDNDHNMYAYKGVTGEVFKYNLQTKELKKIYQTEGSGNLVFYQEHLYLSNYNNTDAKITEIDTDGKLVREIDPGTCYNYFGDSDAMISKKQKRQGNVLVDDYYVYDKNTSEWKMILENEVMK